MIPYLKPAENVIQKGNMVDEVEFNRASDSAIFHFFAGGHAPHGSNNIHWFTDCGLDLDLEAQSGRPVKCIPTYITNPGSPHFALEPGDSNKICKKCLEKRESKSLKNSQMLTSPLVRI